MNRREFLKGTTAALATLSLSPSWAHALTQHGGWLTGYGNLDGTYGAAYIGEDLSATPMLSSKLRLHYVFAHPKRSEICAPARRPGNLIWVVKSNGEVLELNAPETRHYFGHGAYSHDGDRLFTAENDYENERGVIGVYDPNDHYKRLGEFSANGIGPHQLLLHPDKRHLIVANGGILTHPDMGRAKLNLDTMQSNFSIIDLHTQRVVDEAQLTDEYQQMSIRHFAVTQDGQMIFGLQDQMKPFGERPMVGAWQPGSAPRFFTTPDDGWEVMNGYIGSVAVEHGGRIAAAASPRGGAVVFWNIRSGQVLGKYIKSDVCGVSHMEETNRFLVTNGQGSIVKLEMTPAGPVVVQTVSHTLQFDNHCYRT